MELRTWTGDGISRLCASAIVEEVAGRAGRSDSRTRFVDVDLFAARGMPVARLSIERGVVSGNFRAEDTVSAEHPDRWPSSRSDISWNFGANNQIPVRKRKIVPLHES